MSTLNLALWDTVHFYVVFYSQLYCQDSKRLECSLFWIILLGVPWSPTGQNSVLSLLKPRFNPWPGDWDLVSCMMWPKINKYSNDRTMVWRVQAIDFAVVFLSYLRISCKEGVPDLSDLRWSWCNNRNKVHNKCNVLQSLRNHPNTPVHGKIVFHKTHPWCQKDWGLLL